MLTAAGERIADRRLERKGRVPDGNQPAGPGAEQKPWGLGGGRERRRKKTLSRELVLWGQCRFHCEVLKKNNNPHWPLFSTGQRFVRDL